MEALKRVLPPSVRRWLNGKRVQIRRKMLWVDKVTDFGVLRRVSPYRPAFGWHRGKCIDRYYIEKFLSAKVETIKGHVLEVWDATYTHDFGGDRVTKSSVVDLDPSNTKATVVDDLTSGDRLADESFDCIICTQVLQYIYDFAAAVLTMHRKLKPGGVLLVTVPGIAQICPKEMIGAGNDYWRFTRFSVRQVFDDVFGASNVEVESHGNVLTAVGLLHGLVTEELTPEELNSNDPDYEVILSVAATKRHETHSAR